MISKNRLAGIGVFVLGGVVLFATGLFLIGDRRLLFSENFELWTELFTVTGLQTGARVRVAGKDAGEVIEIQIPPGPSSKFRIKMRLIKDLHPLVRTDSVATIQTDGLVGNQFLQISPGTETAPQAPPGSTIPGREPFDFSSLLQQASDTVERVGETIDLLKAEIQRTMQAATATVENANAILQDAGGDIQTITETGNKIAADIHEIIESTKQGKGTIGKLITDESLYEETNEIFKDAKAIAGNLKEASEKARDAIAEFRDKSKGGMGDEAREALRNLNEVLSDMAENTEALKRNWFFRGFYKKRGYYDLDDLTMADYQAGMLEHGRHSKRVWLKAERLFQKDETGTEVLTEEGKERIHEVMSLLLKYPRNSVYVVEGYFVEGGGGIQFLGARHRALLARSYILNRYPLKPEAAGIMPVGLKMDEITGDPWDGIAIVVYYDQSSG